MSLPIPPSHIVIFGRPGSGKSSLAERLSLDHGYTLMRTGELLREAVLRRDPLGVQVESLLKSGNLVPDPVIAALLERTLTGPGTGRILFDGFPRTMGQVRILEQLEQTRGFRVDCFLEVAISREAAILRMTGRRVCPECGATYHMANKPPQAEETCDLDGARLERRKDDALEVIEARQRVFDESTLPVLDYFRTHAPERYRRVDGEQASEAVYAETCRVLGLEDYTLRGQ
ncbi:MAG: adenylate kinase [Chloroflexota bacterium]|nr:adenylate kinase [Chloroflexota bacterium]